MHLSRKLLEAPNGKKNTPNSMTKKGNAPLQTVVVLTVLIILFLVVGFALVQRVGGLFK